VVATATIAAYVSFGGLGRYVFDGLAQRDLVQVLGGAVLVAVVAVALDLALSALQRALFLPHSRLRSSGGTPIRPA
jgi:osmoprotectant transport system permease protein